MGGLNDSNKLILQRVSYLNSLNQQIASNKMNDTLLNERTQKKQFFPNIFMNSEEFKDLGTLHYERRKLDYPPISGLDDPRRTSENLPQSPAGSPAAKQWKLK